MKLRPTGADFHRALAATVPGEKLIRRQNWIRRTILSSFFVQKITFVPRKININCCTFWPIWHQIFVDWRFAPDSTGGAYSASRDPLCPRKKKENSAPMYRSTLRYIRNILRIMTQVKETTRSTMATDWQRQSQTNARVRLLFVFADMFAKMCRTWQLQEDRSKSWDQRWEAGARFSKLLKIFLSSSSDIPKFFLSSS